MEILNRYFSPFATGLVLSALYFSNPDPGTRWLSLTMLALALGTNHFLGRRSYRHVRWTQQLRTAQVWVNLVTSAPLVYLLGPFWAPMWLLFLMAPASAALIGGRLQTLFVACASAATLLGIYALRGLEGSFFWGMASVHAAFIVFFSLFVNALAQTAVQIRDAALGVGKP